MSLSELPLCYCTNVHPGQTVAAVEVGLDRYTAPVRDRLHQPLAAGLWLAKPVVTELLDSPDALARFVDAMARRNLTCHTLNAFPYGDFHSARVKEKVYLPDWSSPDRLTYTLQCAQVLAALLPRDAEGSISTLPLGFKLFSHPPEFLDQCAEGLLQAAIALDRVFQQTGKLIRLAVEPEPLCVLETTAETLDFFRRLRHHSARAGRDNLVSKHVGLCFDVCHQAVEFEDIEESICELDQAAVRINKVHISCAIQLDDPAQNVDGRRALLNYIEPRYLHQTVARTHSGELVRETDLNEAFIANPGPGFAEARAWRVHFHVPVDVHRMGPLSTTRPELINALAAIEELSYAPHLEVETYTWQVLPDAEPIDLVEGLTRELLSAQKLIDEVEQTL